MVSGCSPHSQTVYYTTGTTLRDITRGIKAGIGESARFSRDYSRQIMEEYGPTVEALKVIWSDARKRWRYRVDEPGEEVIASPCEMDRRGYADCKDFTTWVAGVLQNMGIPHEQRIIFYDDAMKEGHIFNVAYLDDTEYIVDPVHRSFNRTFSHRSAIDLNHRKVSGPNGSDNWVLALGLSLLGWLFLKNKSA